MSENETEGEGNLALSLSLSLSLFFSLSLFSLTQDVVPRDDNGAPPAVSIGGFFTNTNSPCRTAFLTEIERTNLDSKVLPLTTVIPVIGYSLADELGTAADW